MSSGRSRLTVAEFAVCAVAAEEGRASAFWLCAFCCFGWADCAGAGLEELFC